MVGTAANVNDAELGNALLHGHETEVFADAGYRGALKRPDATGAVWHVAMRPSERKRWKKVPRIGRPLDYAERVKASVRAKVEHPFRVLKLQFGHRKVRYRGLAKNTAVADAVCADEPVAGAAQAAGDGRGRRREALCAMRATLTLKTKRPPDRMSSMRGAPCNHFVTVTRRCRRIVQEPSTFGRKAE